MKEWRQTNNPKQKSGKSEVLQSGNFPLVDVRGRAAAGVLISERERGSHIVIMTFNARGGVGSSMVSVAKLLSSFIAPRRLAARWQRCGERPQSPRRCCRRCSIMPSGSQTPSSPSLTLLACSVSSLLYTQDQLSFTQSGGGSAPQSQHPTPTTQPPFPLHFDMPPHSDTSSASSHPSAVGDFGFLIVFVLFHPPVLLLFQYWPPHTPGPVWTLSTPPKPGVRHFVLSSGAPTLSQCNPLTPDSCGER